MFLREHFVTELGSFRSACESYHLPENLVPHIDFVTPTVHFDAKLSKRSGDGQPLRTVGQPGSGNGPKTNGELIVDWSGIGQLFTCDKYITPFCLRTLYGLFYSPIAANKNSYGIGKYGSVAEPTLAEVACSRVYPRSVPSRRSQFVRSKVFSGSLWRQPCHGSH